MGLSDTLGLGVWGALVGLYGGVVVRGCVVGKCVLELESVLELEGVC